MDKNIRNGILIWKERKRIPIYLFFLYFLFIIFIYLKTDFLQKMQRPSTYIILLLWLALTLISLLEIEKVRNFYKKHAILTNAIVLLLSPVASFLVVETMVSNFNTDMFLHYSFYNLIWYIALYYFLYALTRDFRHSITIGNFAIYIASMINYFVYLFRGNPILPSDLLAWQTGMSVASGYHVNFSEGFLIATLILYFIYVMGYKLEKVDKRPSVMNRIIVAGSFVVFAAVVFNLFFETDLIKSKIAVLDFFAPKYTYCSYGTAFGFAANVKALQTEAPEGYSSGKVKNILNQANTEETSTSASEKNKGGSTENRPNIIVIMNEAFSDLSMLGDFKTNMDYLPFIRSMKENTVKGTMYTSVFGGATSDTEYEFLTGNSMAVMPMNCVPYQQFVTDKTDSLASTLKAQGYYNIAIHPFEPSGYKRDMVYPLLGFDEFLSMKDFKNPTFIRNFISDSSSYQKIIEQYENKGKDKPLFIFNVTMQNHGGYSGTKLFDDADNVYLTQDTGHPCSEQYLSLLRKSDQAFEQLIHYFSKQKEHTIILLFGDHQPIAYQELHDLLSAKENLSEQEALRRKYIVPFVMWSNYDRGGEKIDQISANYLSSYLLRTAGLKETTYNRYLNELYQKVPVINALFYIDRDNVLHNYSETTAYSDAIKQYRNVGYNDVFDKKNKLTQYFYLQ